MLPSTGIALEETLFACQKKIPGSTTESEYSPLPPVNGRQIGSGFDFWLARRL